MEKHRARLAAELTRVRVKKGFATIDAFRESLGQSVPDGDAAESGTNGDSRIAKQYSHPRWLRVNTLKTTLEDQLSTTFADYSTVSILDEILTCTSKSKKIIHIDKHIPNLLVLPRSTEISKLPAFTQGLLIAQDKASCFPAYLLNPRSEDGDVIDACAAPGNKTTHLAAILRSQRPLGVPLPRIWACEKDKSRALVLHKMVRLAGAGDIVTLQASQDFLRLDPKNEPWSKVGALLLDPSCSGSGIIGRDEQEAAIVLPSRTAGPDSYAKIPRQRKRKRSGSQDRSLSPITPAASAGEAPQAEDSHLDPSSTLSSRLTQLSTFQKKLLLHAFSFPSARKITYSTCSIYAEENENVVWNALADPIAKQHGWRILKRDEQVDGMREWSVRGNAKACGLDGNGGELYAKEVEGMGMDEVMRKQTKGAKERVRDACIRCEMGATEGTQGFFVVGFVREKDFGREEERAAAVVAVAVGDEEEEWEGICEP